MKKRIFKIIFVGLAGIIASIFDLTAQTLPPISASLPSSICASTPNLISLDCAMVEITNNLGSHLFGICYDNGSNTDIFLEDESTGASLVVNVGASFPNCANASIALADDMNNPGKEYFLLIVCKDYGTGATRFMQYRITGVSTGVLNSKLVYNVSLGTGPTDTRPRIDMFTDPFHLINGYPSLHEFIISRVGPTPGILQAGKSDVNSPGAWTGFPVIVSGGSGQIEQDVATATDITTGKQYAYFVSADGLGTINWDLTELDVSGGFISSVTTILPSVGIPTTRIEAMSLFDPGQPNARYDAVAAISGGISEYNNITATVTNLTPFPSLQGMGPTVAAGPWNNYSPGIGNNQYTMAWYDPTTSMAYSLANDLTGNLISPSYLEIDMNPIGGGAWGAETVAVCNSDNTGDAMLTAWYDGASGNIFYKRTGNTYGYKPTSVSGVANISEDVSIYPNPSIQKKFTVKLSLIEHKSSLAKVSVQNILGQEVFNKTINVDNNNVVQEQINLQNMPEGMYNVTLRFDDKEYNNKVMLR